MKKFIRNASSWFISGPGLRTAIKAGKIREYRAAKKMMRMERGGLIRPIDNLAVIAMFRNEAPHLKEWIEYHKMMGASRFYLFDNESIDNPLSVLESYINDGSVIFRHLGDAEIEKLSETYGQMPKSHIAHHLALDQCRMTAKWVAIIDIDEFIFPKIDATIPKFLQRLPSNAAQVLLGWHCFGSSGHKIRPTGLTIESYLWRGQIDDSRAFKAITNPRSIVVDKNHFHAIAGKTVDENGRVIRHKMHEYGAPSEICPINHYITRSRSECLSKCRKNSIIQGDRYGADFFEKYDLHDIYDDSMLEIARNLTAKK
jgi:hypothetical protein